MRRTTEEEQRHEEGHRRQPRKRDDAVFVTALGRGLEVLRCLADADADLTASEVARRLGLPQATVWRLCYTLVELGYVERTTQDRMRPGLSVLNLGHSVLVRRPFAEVGRARMLEIAARFGGAFSLGSRDDTEMVYLQRVEGGSPIFTGLRVGARVSILSSAMGWAYLAGMPKGEQRSFLEELKERFPTEFGRVERTMLASLHEYPQRKLVVNEGVLHPEINAVAVPVLVSGARPEACLSFGGPRSSFPVTRLEAEIGPLLLELASTLSHHWL